MSELFLVRHAQASFGTGDYDRLSALGHQQAAWLGEHFRSGGLRFDQLICGDMLRQQQTLEAICIAMGLDAGGREVHPEWNEFDFETLIASYLAANPQERPDASAAAPEFARLLRNTLGAWAGDRLEGKLSETWAAFDARVRTALHRATRQGRRVLVVSSGGPIAMALSQVLAAPARAMIQMNIQLRNSAYNHLFFNRDSVQLAGFNHYPHLDLPERRHAATYY